MSEMVQDELGQRLDRYLSRITPFGFAGAALLAKDGEIVLNKGYGLAHRAKGVPITADSLVTYHLSYAQPRHFPVVREGDTICGLVSEQNIMAQKRNLS
jgi:hypothetical protein